MQIIHQSQTLIRMPAIYHRGNILIALWRNSNNACEIRFTVEHQFCQKLLRDHHRSLLSGKYFVILLDSLTIHLWRDHGSDRNVSGTLLWLICSCHSVFLGITSSGFTYITYPWLKLVTYGLSVMILKSLKLSLTISVTLRLFICYFTKEAHNGIT